MRNKQWNIAVHRAIAITLALAFCALNVACPASKPATLPPGALNTFDAQSYVTLMGIQSGLESVKADLAAGKVPASAKPVINKAIASYNAAQASWKAYHAAGAGNNAALTAAITQATIDVTAAIVQISGGH